MKISIIAAVGENGVIGHEGHLPWHLAADMKRFRETTTGHIVIMGRKTYESIGKALPGRTNIVLTRQPDFHAADCIVVPSLPAAFARAKDLIAEGANEEVFVIGGGAVYKDAFPYATKLYITKVHDTHIKGDTSFPEIYTTAWREIFSEGPFPADEKNDHKYSFSEYEEAKK